MSIFNFFTDQVLGMKWLSDLTTSLVENVFNLDITSKLGGSIQFFIYDTIKIFILLGVLIFLISYIQSYFPPEKTKKILTKFKGISGATSRIRLTKPLAISAEWDTITIPSSGMSYSSASSKALKSKPDE